MWAGSWAIPAAPSALFIECMLRSGFTPSFTFKEVPRRYRPFRVIWQESPLPLNLCAWPTPVSPPPTLITQIFRRSHKPQPVNRHDPPSSANAIVSDNAPLQFLRFREMPTTATQNKPTRESTQPTWTKCLYKIHQREAIT